MAAVAGDANVDGLRGTIVVQVAAGEVHSLALTSAVRMVLSYRAKDATVNCPS